MSAHIDMSVFTAFMNGQFPAGGDYPSGRMYGDAQTEWIGLGRDEIAYLIAEAEHGHLIEALFEGGAHVPNGSDIEDHLTALTDAAAWLHSDVFDTDRAALRLTGGAA